jgi:hypothetical protein
MNRKMIFFMNIFLLRAICFAVDPYYSNMQELTLLSVSPEQSQTYKDEIDKKIKNKDLIIRPLTSIEKKIYDKIIAKSIYDSEQQDFTLANLLVLKRQHAYLSDLNNKESFLPYLLGSSVGPIVLVTRGLRNINYREKNPDLFYPIGAQLGLSELMTDGLIGGVFAGAFYVLSKKWNAYLDRRKEITRIESWLDWFNIQKREKKVGSNGLDELIMTIVGTGMLVAYFANLFN